jgi:flagellar protein FlaF
MATILMVTMILLLLLGFPMIIMMMVAAFIGFGMFYTATANSFEQINDARNDRADRTLDRENTEIALTDVTYNESVQSLNITARNTGTTDLELDELDVLADNTYLTGYRSAVEGDETTNLWLPREQLVINATGIDTDPGQATIVTGPGISATDTTTVVS